MANGKLVNTVNSVHHCSYTAGDLRFASRRARGRPRLRTGAEKSPAWLPCASKPLYLALAVAVAPAPFLCFQRRRCHSSVELLPSNQRPRHCSKACSSSASSLCVQQTSPCGLSSPKTRGARSSSSRPAASPSRVLRRGQCVTVILCPC